MLPRPASYADHSTTPPDLEAPGAKTWITRGANLVIAVSDVTAGTVLARDEQPDEYMVFMAAGAATIQAGDESIVAAAETLTIVPPGASRVTAASDARVVRVFSPRAGDLAARACNAGVYADGAPECAPIVPWPTPPDGFRLRQYVPLAYEKPETNMRIFRSTNLMVNVMTRRDGPRDPTKLSPHSHDDFEQCSVVLEGDYVHHLRWPWTPDQTTWRDDEHVTIGAPSVTVIPAKVVHTSNNVGPKRSWLLDVFAPPRMDFSKKPGMVLNAADYPVPAEG
ncbi:hypothetical protein [Rhodoplanes roseus]|uniref:Cupin 2 conserved barrel domain-containing protein n=1 Tax=Rhodoplanes roseus TaxID=29409 RepID=A0A327L0U6_9BRAD|nr:hypothetical protein [Rhodoplanes roseus]RAI44579.1 hypothetical protein CH341_08390 [Rhodoplanes roseus]